jgi:hypothetical protein
MRQEYLTKSFPFLENCPIQVIEDEIMKLEEGDHLLIIEWNSAVLAQHEDNDPTHTKAVLVSTITAHGGSNLQDSQCVFGFTTTVTFSACRGLDHLDLYLLKLAIYHIPQELVDVFSPQLQTCSFQMLLLSRFSNRTDSIFILFNFIQVRVYSPDCYCW